MGEWRELVIQRMTQGGNDNNLKEAEQAALSREQAERLLGAKARNMNVFLTETLEGEFGGVDTYLQKYCGFGQEDLLRIRENLVVQGEGNVSVEELRRRNWDLSSVKDK